ncbi:MAG: hypothetical protein ABJK39_01635 [Hyphomicrobiales bacterium]
MKALSLTIALLLATMPTLTMAQTTVEKEESLTAWYAALQKVDVAAMEGLMAPEDSSPFKYEITDLSVEQNRKEFIESMAEWAGAISGGSIDYKITEKGEGFYRALVCYRFVGSELLAEETVSVYDTKITSVAQIAKGDSCADF